MYWRKRVPPRLPIDPDTAGCGLLWHAFVLPFDGPVIEDVLARVDALMLGHGFEPVTSLVTLNDRYVRVFVQLIYDRDVFPEFRPEDGDMDDIRRIDSLLSKGPAQ